MHQRSHAIIATVILLAALGSGSCAKKGGGSSKPKPKPKPKPTPTPTPGAKCRPDGYSRIPRLKAKTDAERFCAKDADCEVSLLTDGHCCGHGCNGRSVYPSAFLKRLRVHRRSCCDGAKFTCKQYSCPKATTKVVARCKDRHCVGERVPLGPPRRRHPGCAPDAGSRIPKLMPSGKHEFLCRSDSDCVVSSQIPGSCCTHGCNRRWVHTRVYDKRLRGYLKQCCAGHKLNCARHRCPKPTHRTVARCVKQRCVAAEVPVQ